MHAHRILLLTEELASNSSAGGGSPTSFLTRITCSPASSSNNHSIDNDDKSQKDEKQVTKTSLPEYKECHVPTFVWGRQTGDQICRVINSIYQEVFCWRCNLFKVPSGKVGREFVNEMARLLFAFEQDIPLECIAIKAVMILPALLLQKPSPKCRSKDHTNFLRERLAKWKEGAFDELLEECRTIQDRLTNRYHAKGESGKNGINH